MLERCTQWGHPLAANLLLDVYEGRRKGLDAQPEKASILARHLAEGTLKLDPNHPESVRIQKESMYRYALYCEKGFGHAKSEKDALHWMLKAANADVGRARVELARYLMVKGKPYSDPRTALKLLRSQATKDPYTPNVFFYLGHAYMSGLGVPRPMPQLAFECYQMGEKVKDHRAINNLAAMYERGIVASRDLSTALHLYKKAADLGNKEASANMQRLAYIKAEIETGTPQALRVNHATMQVIERLPISRRIKELLVAPLKKHSEQIRRSL
jgi:TPR repeat protein